jgi:hypothetical protein
MLQGRVKPVTPPPVTHLPPPWTAAGTCRLAATYPLQAV